MREVQTKEGKPLQRYPLQIKQVFSDGPVYLLTWAMEKVMTIGTGSSAYSVLSPNTVLAGKSGTTDDYRDSWFAGFGADRVTVIWVGRDDNRSRSEEHTSELQSLMRISYAVFCLKKKTQRHTHILK